MYHGIIIDQGFDDVTFLASFKQFSSKVDGSWKIIGIEVQERDIKSVIENIQRKMKSNQPWYAHFYSDTELIVVFKEQLFYVTPHSSTWKPILEYGRKINIPEQQLDFWPNRFQDEKHYFGDTSEK
jgi:hypothetical protein